VFMIGGTERAWSIGTADYLSFSLIALILLGPTRAQARVVARPEPSRARHERRVAVPSG
jgi:hypothetical protein